MNREKEGCKKLGDQGERTFVLLKGNYDPKQTQKTNKLYKVGIHD